MTIGGDTYSKICLKVRMMGRLAMVVAMMVATTVIAEDWPHWNGPRRDGSYAESGTLRAIPQGGLKKIWSQPVALGYAGPAVAGGRVFVSDYVKLEGESTNNPGGRDRLRGTEGLHAFDSQSGTKLWSHTYDRDYYLSYPGGPRATPTIDGDYVYLLGAEGDLRCLKVGDGQVVWQRQLAAEYRSEAPIWGYSAAPFIHGDLLYCLAGGQGSLIVALDKRTGVERWRALSGSSIGYCPPSILKAAGREQLLVWEPQALHALDPQSGELLWTYPIAPKYEMSIIPPVIQGDRMYVSGIGEVGAMLAIDQDKPGVKELWKGKVKHAVYAANSTPVFDGDYLYGADCGQGCLVAVRASDGERMWETYQPTAGGDRRQSHGTAFLSKVGDIYYLFSETGDFIIARLTPDKYEELGRTHILEPTNECFGRSVVWSYPAYADRSLFVRNDKEIACYSLAAE
jgi:outer membrane protein assembly factor BamB